MAEPKKRTNKSKTGMRRMHIKAVTPSVVYCSNCHEAKPLHVVCPACGYYKGKLVVAQKEKVEVEEAKEEIK